MISAQAKFVNAVLRLIKLKRFVNYEKPARTKKQLVPYSIRKKYLFSYETVKEKLAVTVSLNQNGSGKHILFLHGGAYVNEGINLHWNVIENLIKTHSYKVTYVDYPLAPEHTYKETFEMLQKTYDLVTEKYPNDEFIFMGDSAGGGLALAFAQKLQLEHAKILPVKLVLFSPWLDLAMSNPLNPQFEKTDTILSIEMLKVATELYSGGEDMNQYLLSPINGNLNNLPPTAVFYGTDELFYPDCIKLKSLVLALNSKFTFFEYEQMQHDWVLFPIPEAKRALDEACRFIES